MFPMERSISSSADARGKNEVNADDQISKLSNDLLLKILSTLSMEEIVRTSVLSKRWVDVWKETSSLFLDMRRLPKVTSPPSNVTLDAKSVTKVIKDHRGHLESCTICHNSRQCEDGVVENWIQLLIHQKHIKQLSLESYLEPARKPTRITLNLPPESLSHPNLKSLSLGSYAFNAPHAFNNCRNLKRLKLDGILAEVEVFNEILASCSSLEALTLDITSFEGSGFLEIGNPKLQFLDLSCSKIDGVEVSTHSLDILSIRSLSCAFENFIIANPRFQQFSRNFWATGHCYPHTIYDITCSHQEKKSIGHELMTSGSGYLMQSGASLSVSVNMTNTKEVEMLKEVFAAWPNPLAEIEIVFKNNKLPMEEGESSIGRTRKKFWENTRQLANAGLHAYRVWLVNLSGSQEEFELASHLITQGMVFRHMMIIPLSSCSPSKKLEIETVVAKLKKLPKRHKELDIEIW
ncbi:unnamed protein product [Microthlaspi erraticum]|uniref:F-box domain-containing protein n=1 Tax=Microthlaspi erraticum TaxID=1685480 RepID=A0A6D2K4E0_9BRAS|nr:unnamed protein product [Microthlaspi erraticum]